MLSFEAYILLNFVCALFTLIIVIYRYASFRIGMSRRGDLHEASKRDDEYDSRRECLLFGRAVDRLYLRSGLSSGRAQPEWQRGTSHVEDPRVTRPLLTREFTIARCSSFIGRHSAYIDRKIRVERAACVRGRGYSRS